MPITLIPHIAYVSNCDISQQITEPTTLENNLPGQYPIKTHAYDVLERLSRLGFAMNAMRRAFDFGLVKPIRYLRFATCLSSSPEVTVKATVMNELHTRSISETIEYIFENMPEVFAFETREALWDHALQIMMPTGIVAELGVHNGYSINYFAKSVTPQNRLIYGFDSFEGLAEDWPGLGIKKGHFGRGGSLPECAQNVRLIKGWFVDSIPKFLDAEKGPVAFLHIDCDTYASTVDILRSFSPRITAGTIIVFDEYFGYHGWKVEEFRAWQEFVEKSGIRYEYFAFSERAVGIKIL